jgi:hypothetical protein
MAGDSAPYVPFSQRTGLEPIPPQLKIGEASGELRALIQYALSLEITRESYAPYTSAIFKSEWKRVAMDLYVRFFKRTIDTFKHGAIENKRMYERFIHSAEIGPSWRSWFAIPSAAPSSSVT